MSHAELEARLDDLASRREGEPELRVARIEFYEPGSFSYRAASDVDYYGYSEIEFEVLDRRGRHAPWLERKLDDAAIAEIEEAIGKYMTRSKGY